MKATALGVEDENGAWVSRFWKNIPTVLLGSISNFTVSSFDVFLL